MKQPPIGTWFKGIASWRSYYTDGDYTEHAPEEIIGIRYKDYISFIHKGQPYKDEAIDKLISWTLI